MKKAILEPHNRGVVPASFNQVAYQPRFVLSVDTRYRNVSGLLQRLGTTGTIGTVLVKCPGFATLNLNFEQEYFFSCTSLHDQR
jgi:hypothetical protein